MPRFLLSLIRGLQALLMLLACCLWPGLPAWAADPASPSEAVVRVPILVYHRFGPEVADSMTVRTRTVAAQLDLLERTGHTVIPLQWLVDYLQGRRPSLPAQVCLQRATCCVHLFKNRGRSAARAAATAVVT